MTSTELTPVGPTLPMVEPLGGIPEIVDTPRGLTAVVAALQGGHGPLGVDAERASGFRYGQRAYLVQVHRRASGTWLIDPIALPDLSRLAEAMRDLEWILHAASQDLPCLAEIGLIPTRLFDTELAGRLLGKERVGLAPLVAGELGWHLEKGHGAADWSTRPIPPSWRRYAALDVEVLPDLRDRLAEELVETGKWDWAAEEFASLVTFAPPSERVDPWRRTSGIHGLKGRRALGIVRQMWWTRDEIARRADIAPGRLLPDSALVAVATAPPPDRAALSRLGGFARGRGVRYRDQWWAALQEALALPEHELPPLALRGDGPPPPRAWPARDPMAASRLHQARDALAALSTRTSIPVENLGSPEALRRILWDPPEPTNATTVDAALAEAGVRPWQRALVVPILVAACTSDAPSPGVVAGAEVPQGQPAVDQSRSAG